ncbi:MAG: hypothetical protein ACREMA_01325 [Longimicrobiales bacterium]
MYEMRIIPDSDLPEAASEQDLMNMGLFRVEGDLFQCVGVFADGRGQHAPGTQLPGQACSRAGYLNQRWASMPPQLRGRVLRARVYRHRDLSKSLRHLVNDNNDPARLRAAEAASRARRVEARTGAVDAALDLARGLAADAGEPVDELLVAIGDIRDGDVVELDGIPAVTFAGEPLR